MLKKTITYKDYNGATRSRDFYFNLNKLEVVRIEANTAGGLAERLRSVMEAQDTGAILAIIENLIQKSYGVKTPDGEGFMKRREDLEAFMATEAYSELFMELASDANKAAEFFNGILPQDAVNK